MPVSGVGSYIVLVIFITLHGFMEAQGQFWPPRGGFWNPGAPDFFRRLNTGRFSDGKSTGKPGGQGGRGGGLSFGSGGTLAGINMDCSIDADPGPCTNNNQKRWYFDEKLARCISFTYGGCLGNPNNYRDKDSCDRKCNPGGGGRPEQSPCLLGPDKGPCQGRLERFFYNSNSRQCELFGYGGCDGNQNNFKNINTCREVCMSRGTGPAGADNAIPPQQGPPFQEGRGPGDGQNINICLLPTDDGNCQDPRSRTRVTRYFFDPNTGVCRPFDYTGCGGNGNNFIREDDCISDCGPRQGNPGNNPGNNPDFTPTFIPSPIPTQNKEENISPCLMAPLSGGCRDNIRRFFYDPQINDCRDFSYSGCEGNRNNFEKYDDCMNQCFIRPPPQTSTPQDLCVLTPEKGPCNRNIPRFYFDPNNQQCKEFSYGGCQGNPNNFEALDQCENSCMEALGILPGGFLPSLTPEVMRKDACFQPPLVGPCQARIPRFFFDANIGKCRGFMYGGCDGNDNNFNDVKSCEIRCFLSTSDPVTSRGPLGSTQPGVDMCLLPALQGPCNARIARFYHDSTTAKCKPFVFGGCQGNENNFKDLVSCETRCRKSDIRISTTPIAGNRCYLPAVTGKCRARFVRFFFDPKTGNCREFVYGGCEGNANNFNNQQECETECVPQIRTTMRTKNDCASPSNSGRCLAFFRRFYFDVKTQTCLSFVYGGCGGNENNYKTKDECQSICSAVPTRADNNLMKCPAPPGIGACVDMCTNDSNCGKDQKCCSNGCGRLCIRM